MIGRVGSSIAAITAGRSGATAPTTDLPNDRVGRGAGTAASIADFGASPVLIDNCAAVQRAIDAMDRRGGGWLFIPAGTFRIGACVRLRSNITLHGAGAASILLLVNDRRGDALRAEGSATARLSGIVLRDFQLQGDARFQDGKPTLVNGGGVVFRHTDDCGLTGLHVTGFSDGGIAFLDGDHNSVMGCHVSQTGQGIAFTASERSVTGNVAIGNRIGNSGEYNGLHLEGGFGGRSTAEVQHSTLNGNTVSESWEVGINIELAPYTSCVGNTVDRSGIGGSNNDMGVKLYGSYRSSVCGNTIARSSGHGIVVGANSGECAIEGNVTAENAKGSLLLTDSGAHVTNDVAIGFNSFTEGTIETRGNVSIRNRTAGLRLGNRDVADPGTLDWYEEGVFSPSAPEWEHGSNSEHMRRTGQFTRIGNVVHFTGSLGTMPHKDSGATRLAGLPYPAAADTIVAAAFSGDSGTAPIAAWLASGSTEINIMAETHPKVVAAGEGTITVSGVYLTSR